MKQNDKDFQIDWERLNAEGKQLMAEDFVYLKNQTKKGTKLIFKHWPATLTTIGISTALLLGAPAYWLIVGVLGLKMYSKERE